MTSEEAKMAIDEKFDNKGMLIDRDCGVCQKTTPHSYLGLVFHTPEDFEKQDRHTAKYRCLACGNARYEPFKGPR